MASGKRHPAAAGHGRAVGLKMALPHRQHGHARRRHLHLVCVLSYSLPPSFLLPLS